MEKFNKWLANSPAGTAIKIGASASVVWLLENISAFNLSPAITAAAIALLTVSINYLNPQDTRYGKGARNDS